MANLLKTQAAVTIASIIALLSAAIAFLSGVYDALPADASWQTAALVALGSITQGVLTKQFVFSAKTVEGVTSRAADLTPTGVVLTRRAPVGQPNN